MACDLWASCAPGCVLCPGRALGTGFERRAPKTAAFVLGEPSSTAASTLISASRLWGGTNPCSSSNINTLGGTGERDEHPKGAARRAQRDLEKWQERGRIASATARSSVVYASSPICFRQ